MQCLRFLIGLIGFPLIWALARAVVYALASGLTSGGLFTPGACGFALGAITMAALTVWFKTKIE